MKKTVNFFLIFLCSVILFSCSYDDTEIWSEIYGSLQLEAQIK